MSENENRTNKVLYAIIEQTVVVCVGFINSLDKEFMT